MSLYYVSDPAGLGQQLTLYQLELDEGQRVFELVYKGLGQQHLLEQLPPGPRCPASPPGAALRDW